MEIIVRQIEKLPTINTVAFQVIQMCSDIEVPIPRLVRLISGDQSLTAQILKIANSSYFNFPRTIYSLDRAIVILGFNLLKDIAVSLSIFSLYKSFDANKYFDLKDLWRHSIYTGFALKSLADDYDPDHKDILYVSGLLHDIGKLVLIKTMSEDYYIIQEKSQQENKRLFQVEETFLGFDHARIGARLLDEWHLPESVVEMVKYHHEPGKYRKQDEISPWIRLVYLGNLLVHALEDNTKDLAHIVSLDPYFENYFSFSDLEITHMIEKIENDINEQSDYLKLFGIE